MMTRKIILLTVFVTFLSACTTTNKQAKSLSGDVYQFNIYQTFYTEIVDVGKNQAHVSYPGIPCKGVLDLVEKDEASLLYKETITEGVELCTQGGYVRLEQSEGKHFFYYFWPTANDFYAQGELFAN